MPSQDYPLWYLKARCSGARLSGSVHSAPCVDAGESGRRRVHSSDVDIRQPWSGSSVYAAIRFLRD